MSRHILAICDSADYVNHFLRFVKNNKGVPFETVGFTETGALEDFIKTHEVEIVLLSEDMLVAEGEGEMSRVKTVAYLGEKQDLTGKAKYLCKYRPAKLILGDLLDIFYSGKQELKRAVIVDVQIYGIYSLGGSGDKVRMAMSLADKLSKDGDVLYMNLERFSGLECRFDVQTDADLSDLIYFFKTNSEMFRRTIADAVTKISGVDTILAPENPEDIDELDSETLSSFLEKISNEGNYQAIILDIPESFRNLISAFDCCRQVYLLCDPAEGKNEWSKCAFRRYFEKNGREDILDKIMEAM